VTFLTNASDLGGGLEFGFGDGPRIRKIEVVVIRKARKEAGIDKGWVATGVGLRNVEL
jgi:hypothetical protein